MDLFGVALLVGFVYVCWRESKMSQLRSTASAAVLACEEEILRLRGGIMSGRSQGEWSADIFEIKRQDLLIALSRFHGATHSNAYDGALIARSVPSFQDPSEWENFQILGRGPFSVHEPEQ